MKIQGWMHLPYNSHSGNVPVPEGAKLHARTPRSADIPVPDGAKLHAASNYVGLGTGMFPLRVLALFACLFVLSALTPAQDDLSAKPSWYFSAFGGHSFRIISSQEIRTDYGFGAAWAQPEPHFRWRHGTAQLVVEGYYEHSNGQQFPTRGKITEALGAIWYARFRFASKRLNLFLDMGEGAQLANSESFDLGTRFNSTPMIGAGFSIRQGNHETLIGLRFLHISNAGLFPRNRGQNQLLLYTAVKF